MWYKDTTLIAQGKSLLFKSKRYAINDEYGLLIRNAEFNDSGSYHCKVLPDELKQSIKLKVLSEEEIMKGKSFSDDLYWF